MSSPGSAAGSVSRLDCIASVRGRGDVKIALFRHLSPLTVNALLRILPVTSRATLEPTMVCLFTSLRVGVEKPRTSFVRGDVAFLASGGLFCVFLSEAKSDRPLNPLGRVEDGLSILEEMKPGDTVSLSLDHPSRQ